MIKVKNINKTFGLNHVLKNISFEIHESEIVAIQGRSGAGKTTLLKIVGLVDKPDTGNIIFDNVTLDNLNESKKSEFRNQKVGFVFQFHNLLPEFNCLENICLPYLIGNYNFSKAKLRAEKVMHDLNIDNLKNKMPNEVSGGEQQRVAIARSLINSPKLVLADEPTGNLDSKNSVEMFNLFKMISQKYNTTFMIITHDNELASKCDRSIKIHDGYIIN